MIDSGHPTRRLGESSGRVAQARGLEMRLGLVCCRRSSNPRRWARASLRLLILTSPWEERQTWAVGSELPQGDSAGHA